MNFYTLASKMNRKIDKDIDRHIHIFNVKSDDVNRVNEIRDQVTNAAINEFDRNVELGITLMLRYKEKAIEKGLIVNNDKLKRTYFITIRPDTKLIDFYDFYTIVSDFVKRKLFIWFECSFEQKGTSIETLGDGFHVHVIAEMTARSKGEVLRYAQSTFKCCTAPHCIQIEVLSTQKDLTQTRSYLIEYTSDDGHKEPTKEFDQLWRERESLKDLYTQDDLINNCLPSIKSNVGQAIVEIKDEPLTISFN